jgi:hypothetical protein
MPVTMPMVQREILVMKNMMRGKMFMMPDAGFRRSRKYSRSK